MSDKIKMFTSHELILQLREEESEISKPQKKRQKAWMSGSQCQGRKRMGTVETALVTLDNTLKGAVWAEANLHSLCIIPGLPEQSSSDRVLPPGTRCK